MSQLELTRRSPTFHGMKCKIRWALL